MGLGLQNAVRAAVGLLVFLMKGERGGLLHLLRLSRFHLRVRIGDTRSAVITTWLWQRRLDNATIYKRTHCAADARRSGGVVERISAYDGVCEPQMEELKLLLEFAYIVPNDWGSDPTLVSLRVKLLPEEHAKTRERLSA